MPAPAIIPTFVPSPMLAMGREEDLLYMTHEAHAASWKTESGGIPTHYTVAADYGTTIIIVDVTTLGPGLPRTFTYVLRGMEKNEVVALLLAGAPFEPNNMLTYEQAHHYGH